MSVAIHFLIIYSSEKTLKLRSNYEISIPLDSAHFETRGQNGLKSALTHLPWDDGKIRGTVRLEYCTTYNFQNYQQ